MAVADGPTDLVFASELGTQLDAEAQQWTPELRRRVDSLLSDGGASVAQISELVGDSGTRARRFSGSW
jgi:hypothetical protein